MQVVYETHEGKTWVVTEINLEADLIGHVKVPKQHDVDSPDPLNCSLHSYKLGIIGFSYISYEISVEVAPVSTTTNKWTMLHGKYSISCLGLV